jgi:hypothetical protein
MGRIITRPAYSPLYALTSRKPVTGGYQSGNSIQRTALGSCATGRDSRPPGPEVRFWSITLLVKCDRDPTHPTVQSSLVCTWPALFFHSWFGASCGCGWQSRKVSAVAVSRNGKPPAPVGGARFNRTDRIPTTAPGSAQRRNYSGKSLLERRFPCSQQQQSYRRSVSQGR